MLISTLKNKMAFYKSLFLTILVVCIASGMVAGNNLLIQLNFYCFTFIVMYLIKALGWYDTVVYIKSNMLIFKEK